MEKQDQSQLTQKEWLVINQKGFSVVEVLLAAAVFGLIVTSLFGVLIYGEKSSMLAGQEARAVYLAEEGLEAVRNIRDAGFTSLPADGQYGLQISANKWAFLSAGTSDTTDVFTRHIDIATFDTDRKTIISTVTWDQTPQRTDTISLTTRMTYWQKVETATCSNYCVSLGTPAYTTGTCRRNNGACVANGETRQSGGNSFCTVNPNNTCCCHP